MLSMRPTLDALIASIAREVAERTGWPIDAATALVQELIAEPRARYRALCAPFSDTDDGFVIWFTGANRPPSA